MRRATQSGRASLERRERAARPEQHRDQPPVRRCAEIAAAVSRPRARGGGESSSGGSGCRSSETAKIVAADLERGRLDERDDHRHRGTTRGERQPTVRVVMAGGEHHDCAAHQRAQPVDTTAMPPRREDGAANHADGDHGEAGPEGDARPGPQVHFSSVSGSQLTPARQFRTSPCVDHRCGPRPSAVACAARGRSDWANSSSAVSIR